MNLTEQQYERIARCLDGQSISLTADEQAGLEAILADEAAIGRALAVPAEASRTPLRVAAELVEVGCQESAVAAMLDVDVSTEVIDRVWLRTRSALAKPHRRLFGLAGAAASVAAAAAAILIMAMVARQPQPTPTHPNQAVAVVKANHNIPADVYVQSMSDSVSAGQDPAVSLLASEIDQYQADVVASNIPAPVDAGIDQTEKAVEEFWLDKTTLD